RTRGVVVVVRGAHLDGHGLAPGALLLDAAGVVGVLPGAAVDPVLGGDLLGAVGAAGTPAEREDRVLLVRTERLVDLRLADDGRAGWLGLLGGRARLGGHALGGVARLRRIVG